MSAATARAEESPAERGEDWAVTTADTIERLVGSVRAKTADPLEKVVRGIVYGTLAAIVGIAAIVLITVALERVIITLIDLVTTREVWLAHLISGGIFCTAGLFLWSKRTSKTVQV
jgi:hypothetical protein